jgi:AraC family transcriptional regulator, regulatory protein of adaptative response / DNA-3-methyladenine glycosylase II
MMVCMNSTSALSPWLDANACYAALSAHDVRFDGLFFTAVKTTGVYCRPVCRVRRPRQHNCQFFALAAQAEAAGFRPCLRCRPELAPGSPQPWSHPDALSTLAAQALPLLRAVAQDPSTRGQGVEAVARRLGVSSRHLHRLMVSALGVSPAQYVITCRLLAAKQWLTDTALPIAQVAHMAGFGSARRLQAAFAQAYGLQPSALRRARSTRVSEADAACVVHLAYRPPLNQPALLDFFRQRAVSTVEWVGSATEGLSVEAGPQLVRTLALTHGGQTLRGWVAVHWLAQRHQVQLVVAPGLIAALPVVVAKVRAWLDLDADPSAIEAVLGPAFPGTEGWRVPGSVDGFELAVRAILGQQVTVAAARTLVGRLVAALGEPVHTPWPALTHLFPSAAAIAVCRPDTLGALGIVRQRQKALQALAQAVCSGALSLEPGAPLGATLSALQALPGIGDWTAQYIALRGLRWPDAFPSGDVALHNSLGVRGAPKPAQAALQAAEAWRPWRGYAVIRIWHGELK